MSKDRIKEVLNYAAEKELIVLADEVYQENIYADKEFHSFKKVLAELEPEKAARVKLVSFHSLSKGIFGECGLRGGYMELVNFEPDELFLINKLQKSNMSNLYGQIGMDFMARFLSKQFEQILDQDTLKGLEEDYQSVYESLKYRAQSADEILNKMDHVTSNPIEGALYAFPQLHFPASFLKQAERENTPADVLFCLKLLEETGICVVPGSGFG